MLIIELRSSEQYTMKPGNLVKIKSNVRRLKYPEPNTYGLVVEYFPAQGNLQECVRIQWPNGTEIEFPHQLEVISEAK